MSSSLNITAQQQIFTEARSFNKFSSQPVADDLLIALYELMKWAPTSMNCQPMHLLFVKSPEAKQRLKTTLMEGNQEKTMAAPVTVIVATDTEFYNNLPEQFPAIPNAKEMFTANADFSQSTAFRNSSMQGAYLILAARTLGLDCGPMSGFDNSAVDELFFPEGRYQSNFLINIGFGDSEGNYPRGPRLSFEQVASIV